MCVWEYDGDLLQAANVVVHVRLRKMHCQPLISYDTLSRQLFRMYGVSLISELFVWTVHGQQQEQRKHFYLMSGVHEEQSHNVHR